MSTYQNGFSALADPTRREIFERLARRPRPGGELAEELPVSRPAVTQHLKVLRDAGLVVDARDGSRRFYQVNPDGVVGMREYLDRFWSDALSAFETAARTEDEK